METGIVLSICGSTLIGLSYTFSKNAHNSNEQHLKNVINQTEWWFSIIFLIAGEIANFLAYGFAPTSVIAPLGTIAVISGSVSAYAYLGEKIKLRNMIGIVLSIIGAIIIVLYSHETEKVLDPDEIVKALAQPRFLIYALISTSIVAILLCFDEKPIDDNSIFERITYGERYMFIPTLLTSLFSGFTVLTTKALSTLLNQSVPIFNHWITYLLLISLIFNALCTLYYTNKALSCFDSTQVLPAEFAFFTMNAVVGSAMLYDDFNGAELSDIAMFCCGCLIAFFGVYLITTPEEEEDQLYPKRPILLQEENRLANDVVIGNPIQYGTFIHQVSPRASLLSLDGHAVSFSPGANLLNAIQSGRISKLYEPLPSSPLDEVVSIHSNDLNESTILDAISDTLNVSTILNEPTAVQSHQLTECLDTSTINLNEQMPSNVSITYFDASSSKPSSNNTFLTAHSTPILEEYSDFHTPEYAGSFQESTTPLGLSSALEQLPTNHE